MLNSDMYIMVAHKCPAYNAIFNIGSQGKELISCITCENFKNGNCILSYIDIVALSSASDDRYNKR